MVQGLTAERFGRFMGRWGAIERDYDVEADGSLDPSAPAELAPAVFGNGGEGEHLYADPSWHFDGEDLPWLHSYTSLFCLQPPHGVQMASPVAMTAISTSSVSPAETIAESALASAHQPWG